MTTAGDIFLAVLAVLFPPLAVWVKRGICSCDSLLNILLLCLGWLPGLLHAWYIIAEYPDGYEPVPGDADHEAGLGGQRVTYYYVARGQGGAQPNAPPASTGTGAPDGGKAQRQLQRGPSYGAVGGESSSQAQGQGQAPAPPTYAEAIKGDNKVQGP